MTTDTPVFRPGDAVCDALFSGDKGYATQHKAYKEGPIEMLSGIWSNDPTILAVKAKCGMEMTKAAPASVDEMGRVTGNGVRSNFYGVQHVNGYPMVPATYPVGDNRGLREEKGLINHFKEPWHKDVLVSLVKVCCEGLEPVPMKLRDGSSAMAPYMTTKMPEKQEIARHALKTAQQSAAWMQKGDFVNPWLVNQCGGAYITVYRRQSSDKIDYKNGVWTPKDRPVADMEYAISGGKRGTYAPASKEFGPEVDFKVPPGFFRERNRTAHGGPLGTNAILMPIAQSIRQNMYSKYAYTFHHTTRDALQTEIRADWKFAIAADVANHDTLWMNFIVDAIGEGMSLAGIQDWWITIYKTAKKMPMYCAGVGPDSENVLIGDWRKPDLNPGLTSGVSTTDIDGSWGMTWIYLLVLLEKTAPELIPLFKDTRTRDDMVRRFLRGKLDIRLKDKSDDALLGWSDRRRLVAAHALQASMKEGVNPSPYMVISYEHGGAFLGSILLYPKSGDFSGLILIGNINSLPINQLSPEYGVQSGVADRSRTKRPFPGLAWETYPMVYGSCPAYSAVADILEKAWYDVRHESYRGLRERMLSEDKLKLAEYIRQNAKKLNVGDLTPIDLEVLADPDKLQHKHAHTDVSPGLSELLFKGLTITEVEPFFRSAYHG